MSDLTIQHTNLGYFFTRSYIMMKIPTLKLQAKAFLPDIMAIDGHAGLVQPTDHFAIALEKGRMTIVQLPPLTKYRCITVLDMDGTRPTCVQINENMCQRKIYRRIPIVSKVAKTERVLCMITLKR